MAAALRQDDARAAAGAAVRAAPQRLSYAEAMEHARRQGASWDYRLGAFHQALTERPLDPFALSELGRAAYEVDELKLAEESTGQAIAHAKDPTILGWALYTQGLLLEDRGDLAGANDAYQRGLAAWQTPGVDTHLATLLRERLKMAAATTSEDVRFRAWVSGYAKRNSAKIQDWWSVNLDEDKALERAAVLCDTTPNRRQVAWFVIEDEARRRWRFSDRYDGDSRNPRCNSGKRGLYRRETQHSISIDHAMHHEWSELEIGLRGQEPAILFQSYRAWEDYTEKYKGRPEFYIELDWDRLTGLIKEDGLKFPWRLGPSLRVSSSALKKHHTLVPILSAERTPSHSAQEVSPLEGSTNWGGPVDASLSISAVQAANSQVRLRIELRDDVLVPGTKESPETGDYLELEMSGHVVLIAAGPDGNFWVRPGKKGWPGALPKVSGNVRLFDIFFSEPPPVEPETQATGDWLLTHASLNLRYHDVDQADAGVKSVVGFSPAAVLVALPAHRRYPMPDEMIPLDVMTP